MLHLLLTLAPIAVIDCLSPGRFSSLSFLLGTERPIRNSVTWLFGTFFGYFLIGFLILFGMGKIFDRIGAWLSSEWNKPVDIVDLIVQLIIGLLLIFSAWKAAQPRKIEEHTAQKVKKGGKGGLVGIFFFGFIPAFMPAPGMLPYFASLDLILRTDLPTSGRLTALLFYNVVFLTTPVTLIVLSVVAKDFTSRLFQSITNFFKSRGKRFLIFLLVALGIVLVADAISFAFGYPLLPYNPSAGPAVSG